MSYNVSYATPPVFDSNSIGYISPTTASADNDSSTSNKWYSTEISLSPGVYIIIGNVTCSDSPDAYIYITSSVNPGYQNIFATDVSFTSTSVPIYQNRLINYGFIICVPHIYIAARVTN